MLIYLHLWFNLKNIDRADLKLPLALQVFEIFFGSSNATCSTFGNQRTAVAPPCGCNNSMLPNPKSKIVGILPEFS